MFEEKRNLGFDTLIFDADNPAGIHGAREWAALATDDNPIDVFQIIRTGRGLTTVPIFILVPQATIKKRFDIDGVAQKWIDRLPQLVVQNWQDNETK